MLRTILWLALTLVALPFVSYYCDTPLAPEQWAVLRLLFQIMLITALTCFVVSECAQNYSQVDKLWSLMPIVYVWVCAHAAHYHPRLVLMAALVSLWGLRLTYNFGRRGGYHWIPWRGEEDYRWALVRQNPALNGRLRWGLFNLFFISLYQQTLILLFTLPAIVAWQGAEKPLGPADWLVAALFLTFLVTETIADQQQYTFQQEKHRRRAAGLPPEGEYAQGFLSTGLWRYVRHPNYASEQSIWLCYYAFSVVATGRWLNWSFTGAILLMFLFLGSSDFSEKISAGKYAGYSEYQRRVPRFWPFFYKK